MIEFSTGVAGVLCLPLLFAVAFRVFESILSEAGR